MRKLFCILFTLILLNSVKSQQAPVRPDSFDWADYPDKFVGRTIILNAYYSSRDNSYVIYQQERSEGGYRKYKDLFTGKWETDYNKYDPATYYCYKSFTEEKTGMKIVVNVPQKYWEDNGRLIPKTLGRGLYKLTLYVSDTKPESVCDGNWVSGSGSNRIFYTLNNISRYNF
jgi:hypothetical protein